MGSLPNLPTLPNLEVRHIDMVSATTSAPGCGTASPRILTWAPCSLCPRSQVRATATARDASWMKARWGVQLARRLRQNCSRTLFAPFLQHLREHCVQSRPRPQRSGTRPPEPGGCHLVISSTSPLEVGPRATFKENMNVFRENIILTKALLQPPVPPACSRNAGRRPNRGTLSTGTKTKPVDNLSSAVGGVSCIIDRGLYYQP